MTPRKPASCVLLLGLCGAAVAAADGDEETTTARVQSTYVWQNKRPFPARYSGPNSLSPAEEISYTFTATAFLGLRPWKNGELYLTPELSQGVAMSNLTGLGGFPNGEANRAAGSHPKLYRQKLFLRQTWNEDGETVAIEGGQNQLAGKASENRWVLTLGNFSVLDMFDGNRYAKDPRSQFFNWSAMTYAAYDYAADARGFGWGFALERHWRDWSLRLGRMSGPVAPNALPVDLALGKHYGDQIELERRYDWNGKPGAWRVLAWRNRARIARFDDALAGLFGDRFGLAPAGSKFRLFYHRRPLYHARLPRSDCVRCTVHRPYTIQMDNNCQINYPTGQQKQKDLAFPLTQHQRRSTTTYLYSSCLSRACLSE